MAENCKVDDCQQRDLRHEIEQLRNALNEVITNGEWTEGEQCGDWKISPEVYETARDALDPHLSARRVGREQA